MRIRRLGYGLLSILMVLAGLGIVNPGAAGATAGALGGVVSVVPVAGTPSVDDGTVLAFGQVGSMMVVGGSFTSVGGVARRGVFAFEVGSNVVSSSFVPVLDGDVQAVWPG